MLCTPPIWPTRSSVSRQKPSSRGPVVPGRPQGPWLQEQIVSPEARINGVQASQALHQQRRADQHGERHGDLERDDDSCTVELRDVGHRPEELAKAWASPTFPAATIGACPTKSPVTTERASPNANTRMSRLVSMPGRWGCEAMSSRPAHGAISSPAVPPSAASPSVSVSSCRRGGTAGTERQPDRDLLLSRRRRTTSRLATLTQASTSASAVSAKSTLRAGPRSRRRLASSPCRPARGSDVCRGTVPAARCATLEISCELDAGTFQAHACVQPADDFEPVCPVIGQ